MDEVKKYAHVLLPVAEFNRMRKCEQDFQKLKKDLTAKRKVTQAEQEGRGSIAAPGCDSSCDSGVENAASASIRNELAAALTAATTSTAATTPAISKELAAVLRHLLRGQDQEGTGELDDTAGHLITLPPLLNKDQGDIVTKVPLADDPDALPAVDAEVNTGATGVLTQEQVLAEMPVSKRKGAKVLVEAILSLDKVSVLENGTITVNGKVYTKSEFTKLVSLCFRRVAGVRVRGKDHFFNYLTRMGLMTLVPNKKLVELFGQIAPGADGAGKIAPPLTAAEKRILAGKWWQV